MGAARPSVAECWSVGAVCGSGKFARAQWIGRSVAECAVDRALGRTTTHYHALLLTKSLLYPRPVEPEQLERARNRRQEFKIDFEALAAIKERLVILLTL